MARICSSRRGQSGRRGVFRFGGPASMRTDTGLPEQ